MQKKLVWGLVACPLIVSLLAACGSGNNSINTLQQLQVSSSDIDAMVFTAALESSASHTYQAIISSNASPAGTKYTISVALPNASFVVESNGCVDVLANQTCNIQLTFSPTTPSAYQENNLITFSVGELESSIVVASQPSS